MKYLVQILFLILFSLLGKAQNLITNPSFEEIDSCYGAPAPIGFDVFEWSGCTGWSNPIASSSDLWCENPIITNQTPPSIPGVGYQNPHSGQNMAGILVNGGVIISYREYIQNKLFSTLESGVTYDIEFYISVNGSNCFSNEYGVKFFTTKLNDLSQMGLYGLIPDALNDATTFQTDTSIWQLVEMKYLANGAEKYVIIGNFQDSLTTTHTLPCDTSFWGGLTLGGGYFFIDDVSIEKAPPFAEVPNVFTPNNDGINDFILPKVFNASNWEMSIMNRWGNTIMTLNENFPIWNGSNCADGVYFYQLKDEETRIEQGFISIIRN